MHCLVGAARLFILVLLLLAVEVPAQKTALRPNRVAGNPTLNIEKVNSRPVSRLEWSLVEYEKAARANPSDAIALNNLGVVYFLGNRVFESQSALRKAVQLDPHSAPLRVNLAIVLNKTYNPVLAIETLESVLQDDPNFHRARKVLCEFYVQEKRSPDALDCYETLRKNGKLEAVSAANFSTTLIENNEIDRALELLWWADSKFPNDPGIKNGLGVVLFRKKKYALAEENLRRAVELAPSASQLRFNLAMAQIVTNQRGAVLEQYKYLKTSDPELAGRLYKLLFRDKIVTVSPQQ
jgi:Flp pilus assembly protein TadD